MKELSRLPVKTTLLVLVVTLLFHPITVQEVMAADNQNTSQFIPSLEKGMYLIIGAFRIKDNAINYANSVKIEGKKPGIGVYDKTGLYYVYAYKTKEDLQYARDKRTELRATDKFYDAWILYVGLNLEDLEKGLAEKTAREETPDMALIAQPKEIPPPDEMEAKKEEKKEDVDFMPPPPVQQDKKLYNYIFRVINATTLKEVPGYITIIDAARNKAMKSVSSNQLHQLEAPKSQSKEIIALCDIFGYVKEQAKFKIDDPMSSADKSRISQSGGVTTVKFELARHKVGEILTMYHVYFYTNSAIMKPESKFELNSLLDMLKENDKLVIRIHGHTNGNAPGKIIKLKDDDNNFFRVTDNNIETYGSAKELSKARAEVIKRWLIQNGIDEKRMQLKAWGGKKMIYKKNDSMASKNVRVEIEILKG